MWPLTSATVIAWLLSGRRGKIFISDHTELSVSCIRELKISPIILKILMRVTYPFATGIIAVSQGVKEDLCRMGGFPEKRVKVICNPAALGISPHRETTAVREQLWGTSFTYNIVSVGSLKVQKDHKNLIRAFAQLPPGLNA
jgi:glycosyltransferase involved in cell wall biosynthesis